MAQKEPFGCGWSRWQGTVTVTANGSTNLRTPIQTGWYGQPIATGTATAGTNSTLTDSARTYEVNDLVGYRLLITSGSQSGGSGTITSNTATQVTIDTALGGAMDATSVYAIYAPLGPRPVLTDFEIVGGATSTTVAGTITIESYDASTTVQTQTLAKASIPISATSILFNTSNTEIMRAGKANSGVRVTVASGTYSGLAVTINCGGYWLDAGDPNYSI